MFSQASNGAAAQAQSKGTGAPKRSLKVVVVGCTHGELDTMYEAVKEVEHLLNSRIDLIICPGDFQAVRNPDDLATMAVPRKYREMQTFWKYYAGTKHATVPTIFVGGNHEATNHLQEMPLGGLVAPNMYFLGNAGVVRFRGLRIAGISGVYVSHSYDLPRNEEPPYGQTASNIGQHLYQLKTAYRVRRVDVERLKRLRVGRNASDSPSVSTADISTTDGSAEPAVANGKRKKIDVCIGHDWPKNIWKFGDEANLRRCKPFLVEDIENGRMGNLPAMELIEVLQPDYWFAAHMHFKFPAVVPHEGDHRTKFLALDKIVPGRDFLQVLDIPVSGDSEEDEENREQEQSKTGERSEETLVLDTEWLTILRTDGRTDCVSDEEMAVTEALLKEKGVHATVRMKADFERRVAVHNGGRAHGSMPERLNFESRNVALMTALGLPAPAGMATPPSGEVDHINYVER